MLRRLLLLALALVAIPLLYGILGLGLGAVPVGPLGPQTAGPAADSQAIDVYVVSNRYHTSLVLPLRSPAIDWTVRHPADHFGAFPPATSHIGFGWGDRDFYMETRTLSDIRFVTALRAISAAGETVMHVQLWGEPRPDEHVRMIRVTPAQHLALVDFVQRSFAGETPRLYPGRGYGPFDAFYEGVGSYSLFTTCNEWVSQALRHAGLRTGLWTPFALSILSHRT
jgi:uncharacterized protein (TIGR02117 family)